MTAEESKRKPRSAVEGTRRTGKRKERDEEVEVAETPDLETEVREWRERESEWRKAELEWRKEEAEWRKKLERRLEMMDENVMSLGRRLDAIHGKVRWVQDKLEELGHDKDGDGETEEEGGDAIMK
jgi:hypothetical protein